MSAPGYLLGFDLGSSSVKVSLLEAGSGRLKASATSPDVEMPMQSVHPGWAEQDPEQWWHHAAKATNEVLKHSGVRADAVLGIGISYQMHGLVVVDRQQKVLRPSIIWCDSRAVAYGETASKELGDRYCHDHLLNSPGNFTASKLKWVKENEPEIYKAIDKIMLPGDYLAMKLTGQINTTVSGLSEGIFWDFKENKLATGLMDYYGLDVSLIPECVPTFGMQGKLSSEAAAALGLAAGTPVGYRAGDQPNNAFSLKTLHPGELAATAGTSGVIYGIVDTLVSDPLSRVNTFAHVNHTDRRPRLGVLLCVNGTGIMNSWIRKIMQVKGPLSYEELNAMAGRVPIGSDGLSILPFGNGAERMFQNRDLMASLHNLNLNRHDTGHLSRAVQEGIVFSLAYGFDVLKALGLKSNTVRVGKANMFLSKIFCETFSAVTGTVLELYNTDGAQGAARGAGVGVGYYSGAEEAFEGLTCIERYEPGGSRAEDYKGAYHGWQAVLKKALQTQP